MKKRAIKCIILGAVFSFVPQIIFCVIMFAYGLLIASPEIVKGVGPRQIALQELRLIWPTGIFVSVASATGYVILAFGIITYVVSLWPFSKKPAA